MTEAEWLACENPEPLLGFLRGEVYAGEYPVPVEGSPNRCSPRKIALFTRAICSRVPYVPLNQPTLRGMALLDQFSEGELSRPELLSALTILRGAVGMDVNGDYFPFWETAVDEPYGAFWIARKAAIVTAWHIARDAIMRFDPALIEERDPNWKSNEVEIPEWEAACLEARAGQAALLRDVVNYPLRPATIERVWLTRDVVTLASGIYEDQAFDRMPILADALQDAGCDSDDILSHCRGEGPHVRGCWVVDLVLGKS